MVGNDVTEDMVASETGMQVFLLTDCLINKERKDISVYPRGSLLTLLKMSARRLNSNAIRQDFMMFPQHPPM